MDDPRGVHGEPELLQRHQQFRVLPQGLGRGWRPDGDGNVLDQAQRVVQQDLTVAHLNEKSGQAGQIRINGRNERMRWRRVCEVVLRHWCNP